MALRTIERVFITLGACAVIALFSLYVTKSTAQSGQPQAEGNSSPIYGIAIPAGYREWRLISVNNLSAARQVETGASTIGQRHCDRRLSRRHASVPGRRNHRRVALE